MAWKSKEKLSGEENKSSTLTLYSGINKNSLQATNSLLHFHNFSKSKIALRALGREAL
jgi:hypothetical protein